MIWFVGWQKAVNSSFLIFIVISDAASSLDHEKEVGSLFPWRGIPVHGRRRVDCEGVVRIQFHFNIIFQTARFILKNRRQVECAIKRGRAGLINSNKALLLGRMALWPHDSLDGQGHSSRASPAMTVVENYHKKECVSTLFREEYISKVVEYRHNF